MATTTTLCYLIKDNKILLQKKTKELFGGGKWNGPGGKAKEKETPLECAKRELLEEIGVKAIDLEKSGVITFFKGDELFTTCHVFKIKKFNGEPKESREGIVEWFEFEDLPFNNMWPDDKFWMPILISGKKFEGTFYFDSDLKKLLRHDLNVI
jgi:8-oxo-dGTP pyrophosphatase MutT (NUDIX family)